MSAGLLCLGQGGAGLGNINRSVSSDWWCFSIQNGCYYIFFFSATESGRLFWSPFTMSKEKKKISVHLHQPFCVTLFASGTMLSRL